MATIPIIQLLRNNNIYSSRDAARSALEGQKNNVPDGGVILARYSGTTGEQMIIKTLAGFVSNISTSENATVTIIDVEGASENVQDAITSAINKLNKEDTAVYGQYVSSVSEANGIITVTRTPLPSVEKHASVGEAVTAVTQTNGKIGVEYGRINALNVSVDDSMNRFHSDNVDGALNHLFTSLNEAMGSVGMIIDGKINALNSFPSFKSQHIIVSLNQNNGRVDSVFVKEDNIASASLLGTTSDTKDNETAFGRIAKEVAAREDAIDALSTSSKVTLENADGTEGILKVYTIKQGGTTVGTINIPKDLVVTSGSVVKGTWDDGVFTENVSGSGTALKLVIANQTNPVYINTLDLVKDHTSGNGIAISDTNEISVKRDTASENFLTVGADGVKLDGVQNAISAASGHVNTIIDARLGTGVTSESTATDQFAALSGQITSINATIDSLDATVTGGSTHVDVTVGQANGKITSVTVANNDIASATDLTNEITNRTNAIKGISGDTTIDNGKVITAISQRNGIVSVTAATLGAENVSASTIDSSDATVAVTGTNVSAQIGSLATSIKSVSTAAAAAHTVVNAKADGHVTVSIAKSEDDSHDVVTIAEKDIASANDLSAEVSARQSADTTLQNNIDTVNSTLTTHTANTDVHVTQADKDRWNTPTDLSDYYTKTEVDSKVNDINSTIESYGQVTSQALNDLGTRMDDYGHVTSQSLNDLSTKFGDYYTKTEVDTAISNVDVTGQLQNYYTKTEVDSKDATIQTALDALSGDTKTKIDAEAQARTSGDTTLQGNIDALSSSTDTKIANETTARQEADTTLQTNIDNVNSGLTAHTADTTIHVTQADKDKWNTPTDLSNYYTKAEVDGKDAAINSTIEAYGQVTSQALNDLGTRLDDYGKVTSQSLNDLSTKFGDYYTKTEVDEAIANVDVTSQLQNYYTKAEVNGKDATLQTALDALDAHVRENEDIVSQSLNDLNNRIGNTYVKSYIDALEARIAELETKFLNMENNGLQAGEY